MAGMIRGIIRPYHHMAFHWKQQHAGPAYQHQRQHACWIGMNEKVQFVNNVPPFTGLKKLSDVEVQKVRVPFPSKADWWFEGLIQQSPANDGALNAEIYIVKCREDKIGYIAFDRTSQRVYYWCI